MNDEIKFVEVDAKALENKIITSFEEAYGETLYPGDERRIFLMQLLPIIVGLKNDINDTGKQNLLRYARNSVLDALGDKKTPRLTAQNAATTLKFTLSGVQTSSITIPVGTRVTPDGILYFATIDNLMIPAGQTFGEVKAESTEAGEKYNNFAPGQIKMLVDPIPYVANIINTDTSSGGADIEDDCHYRERIRQAPESYSTAGPDGAYIYWAKTADVNISDIAVDSPTPGVVKIIVLMQGGQLPTQSILDKVNAAVNPKNRRPLTDNVQVTAPTEAIYNIDLTYYIAQERSTEETIIKAAIEGAGGAIDQYKSWQSSKLGRSINPDYLRQLMLQTGAFRIEITNPVYATVSKDQVAKLGTLKITYGGLI